jgi:NAD(P)-dependent dehydrogenase (short-subunit alcohol dehydrogenase family)
MRLSNKVALITGGGSGIGRATVRAFAREGARLAVADKNRQSAEAAAEEARRAGCEAIAIGVDVASGAEVKRMVEETVARFGRLDILVNNAGYGIAATVVETEEADWDALMAVNLKGVYLGCKHAIPAMKRSGGGVIVNTASVTAQVGIRNRAAYVASKGGVAALTRAIALDHVADNIRCNAIAPGTIDTPYYAEIMRKAADPAALRKGLEARQPVGRLGTAEEIADGILFLASEEARFMTGSILTVDGGMTAQ